jgi:MYXO-CTERM domain-containing protein
MGGTAGSGGGRAPGGRGGSSGFVGSGSIGGSGFGTGGAGAIQDGGLDRPLKKGTTSGGCGCTVPKERTSGWAALAAMASLGLAAGRRQRRQRR